jgi:voltage-gated potassium channel
MSEHPESERSAVRSQRAELQERISDWLDVPLSVLAFIMLGLLVAELAGDLGPTWARRVEQAQTAIWAIFASAFGLELILAPSKVGYLKKNWLTAISVALPALRTVRLLRVARAFRGLRLVRLVTGLNRGTRALGTVARRGQLGYVLLLTLVVTVTSAAGAYYFERTEPTANIMTPGDAFWWAATIVTTINSPYETISFEGRVIALLLRVFALSISGYLTAIIAAYLIGENRPAEAVEADRSVADETELRRLREEIGHLERLIERRLPASQPGAGDRHRPAPL